MSRLVFAAGILMFTVFASVLVVRAGPEHDPNQDGLVDLTDALDVLSHFGEAPGTPTPISFNTYSISHGVVAGAWWNLFCDPGDAVTGGGAQQSNVVSATYPVESDEYPLNYDGSTVPAGLSGWHISAWGSGVVGFAVCLDNPPEHVADPCLDGSAVVAARWSSGNDHCYQGFATQLGWLSAKSDCESRGGYLATLTSAEENSFVWTNVGLSDASIGLSDGAQEGVWVWVSGEPSVYTNWHVGEPNDGQGGPVEDAASFHGAHNDGTWNDHPLSTGNPYICEFD